MGIGIGNFNILLFMLMIERKQIKDMKILLKDMEPMIKDPRFLKHGRDMENFSLRPREVWANWLICVVLQEIHGKDITFAEDDKDDGIIVDKRTGHRIRTEHVSALENPMNPIPKGEARIIWAINHKIQRGAEYAKNKILVVFFDGAGKWYRNKVREAINDRHNFDSIYVVGLLTEDQNGYAYSVTKLFEKFSISFKVQINSDFTSWIINRLL